MSKRSNTLLGGVCSFAILCSIYGYARAAGEHEQSVCGWEGLAVLALKLMLPDDRDVLRGKSSVRRRVHTIMGKKEKCFQMTEESILTSDSRTLRGYRISQCDSLKSRNRAAILIAHGNAMLAFQTLPFGHELANLGVDIIVYDYRGYGRSEGWSRLKAIALDYKELSASLRKRYEILLGYGASLGGLLLLRAQNELNTFDHLVLDAPPERITRLECPKVYDPINNVPDNASNITLIHGGKDKIVEVGRLPILLRDNGAKVVYDKTLAHPFMDSDANRQRRTAIIYDALRGALIDKGFGKQ